nr:hypothetical protein [Arthrospira sp. PLM2.Bin9]
MNPQRTIIGATHLNQLSGVQDNSRSVVRRSVVRQKSIIGY